MLTGKSGIDEDAPLEHMPAPIDGERAHAACEVSEVDPRQQRQRKNHGQTRLTGKSRKARQIWAPSVLCFASCLVAFFLVLKLHGKPESAAGYFEQGALAVITEAAVVNKVAQNLALSGLISAWDSISVGSEVSGLQIQAVSFEEGQQVRKGQVLAVLDSTMIKTGLEEANAQLRAAQAALAKAIQPNRVQDINALRSSLFAAEARIVQERADLSRAVAQLEQAKANAARFKKLAEQGAVSAQDSENAETAVKTSTAEVQAIEQRIQAARFAADQVNEHLSMAKAGGRKEDIDVEAADIARICATIHKLQTQMEQTKIKAPVDGLIVKRDAHLGDITVSGKPLFSLVRSGRLELRAEVPEKDIAKIRPGQSVDVFSPAYPERTFHGRVRTVSPQVDLNTHMATVRIDLMSQPYLMSGMFVQAKLYAGYRSYCAIPAAAVAHDRGQDVVFTVEGNRAHSHAVRLGERKGETVEVVSGLSAGDYIVVAGAGLLKDGDSVVTAPSQVSGTRGPL